MKEKGRDEERRRETGERKEERKAVERKGQG